MKKIVTIIAALSLLALVSCRGHRTCPTYMKLNSEAPVTASIK